MALTLINNNLHLSTAQLARMEQYRDNVGQHIYFKGDGIKENPFVFNMSSSISVGRPSAIAAVSMVGKNIKFVLTLCHFTQPENMHYSQSYEGEKRIAKAHVYGSDGQKNDKAVTDYVVTEGVHIVGASLERQLNLFVDDQPLLKQGQRPFGTLRKLVIEGDGLTVYEAHFSDARGARLSIFTGNGMEVPETPTLYPSTYVEFGGMPLEKKKSWIEIRPTLAQKEQKQPIYIRKQAGPATERIQVVVKFFEEHISIWTSEGVEGVEPAKHRLPRCLSVYEFILDSMLMVQRRARHHFYRLPNTTASSSFEDMPTITRSSNPRTSIASSELEAPHFAFDLPL